MSPATQSEKKRAAEAARAMRFMRKSTIAIILIEIARPIITHVKVDVFHLRPIDEHPDLFPRKLQRAIGDGAVITILASPLSFAKARGDIAAMLEQAVQDVIDTDS